LKELVSLLLDHRDLLVVLQQLIQIVQGALLGLIGVPTSLLLVRPKVGQLLGLAIPSLLQSIDEPRLFLAPGQ
jgi:hypothetical protein